MLETANFDGATKDELEILTDMVRMKAAVEEEILLQCKKPFRVLREKEVYVYDFWGTKRVEGHPDEVIVAEHSVHGWIALVTDVKTGFLEVDSAECNDQLRAYAIGVPELAGVEVKRVYGKIIQRFFKHNTVEYDAESLRDARVDVLGVVHETERPDAKRVPSEAACRYCKALGTSRCPETSQIVDAVVVAPVAELSGELIARRLDLFAVAEKLIEKEKDLYKAMLEKKPDSIPGYFLKPGASRATIPDSQSAYNRVEDILALDAFQKSLTVNAGKLEDAIGEATGLKGQALKKRFEELLGSDLVKTTNAPSLAKMTKSMLKEKSL